MKFTYQYTLPEHIKGKIRPQEFRQDAAIVSVKLKNGKVFSDVLLVSPDFIGAVKGYEKIPFSPDSIEEVFQTEENKRTRTDSSWKFYIT